MGGFRQLKVLGGNKKNLAGKHIESDCMGEWALGRTDSYMLGEVRLMQISGWRVFLAAVKASAKILGQQHVLVLLTLRGSFGGLRKGQTNGGSHKVTPLQGLSLFLHPVEWNHNLCSNEGANWCLIWAGVKNVFKIRMRSIVTPGVWLLYPESLASFFSPPFSYWFFFLFAHLLRIF